MLHLFVFVVVKDNDILNPNWIHTYLRVMKCELEKKFSSKKSLRFVLLSTVLVVGEKKVLRLRGMIPYRYLLFYFMHFFYFCS